MQPDTWKMEYGNLCTTKVRCHGLLILSLLDRYCALSFGYYSKILHLCLPCNQ